MSGVVAVNCILMAWGMSRCATLPGCLLDKVLAAAQACHELALGLAAADPVIDRQIAAASLPYHSTHADTQRKHLIASRQCVCRSFLRLSFSLLHRPIVHTILNASDDASHHNCVYQHCMQGG